MSGQHGKTFAQLIGLTAAAAVIASPAWAVETTTPGASSGWDLKDAITLSIAVLGAALGLLNTWNAISVRRVRLVVKTTVVYRLDDLDSPNKLGIEVINLSAFAVTVLEVGFLLSGTTKRASETLPEVIDGKAWPRRLEAREAVSTFLGQPNDRRFAVRAAYARLASGEIITGKGRVIRQLRAAMLQGDAAS
jgi:hypothetical protein